MDYGMPYKAPEGRTCEFRNGSCYHKRDAVHVMSKDYPAGKRGTALCAYHSPFDVTGNEPDVPVEFCNCEHICHFARDEWTERHFPNNPETGTGHSYGGVPAGDKVADFVGRICNDCAETHMSTYVH